MNHSDLSKQLFLHFSIAFSSELSRPVLDSYQLEFDTLAQALISSPDIVFDFFDTSNHPTDFCSKFLSTAYKSFFLLSQTSKQPKILTLLASSDNQTIDTNFFDHLFSEIITESNTKNPNALDALNHSLRVFRNHIMALIIWCDLNRTYSLAQVTYYLSLLAEFCLNKTVSFHTRILSEKFGIPRNKKGEAQPFLIIGMGKLGAWELNLSSDIDLIFAFPESGETRHSPTNETNSKRKTLSNQVFFNRLGQAIIQSLDTVTADGFVFRTDMRLRPFGQSGSLTYNFASLEDYYQTQGREWERYAMVKARVVCVSDPQAMLAYAGPDTLDTQINLNAHYREQLSQLLNQFTYRKFIDFSVIEALRGLKKMIAQDIARRKLGDNIKLGIGGIREIEFIAQAFQLIRGGREISLQDNRISIVLPLIEEHGFVPEKTASKLLDAYRFLRETEHAIQGYRDEQTQTLPSDNDAQQRLACAMGYDKWPHFERALNQHRDIVSREFAQVIAPADASSETCDIDGMWQQIWLGMADEATIKEILVDHRHASPDQTMMLLDELRHSPTIVQLQAQGRDRLDQFVPLLLAKISNTATPSQTLARILLLVKSVVRRSAYLLLLIENPGALAQLIKLSEASPWIADSLASQPALLDELLDTRSLYHVPEKHELASELNAHMLRIEPGDLEAQMEALRYFKAAHQLKVAACEVTGILPLMKVSDYLSSIAETILDHTMQLSWREMVVKHGFPDGDVRDTPNFIAVGYGKLGGLELSHGSDLDLVFIHNAQAHGTSDGDKPIDNQRFYMRLGQKIIHMLNTRTASGQLYEVDMRLRPSGNSGMLVTPLNAFDKYQHNEAWTWEHQALVRARVVAGDETLAVQFRNIRDAVLRLPRELPKLQKDVVQMRNKMRTHLGSRVHEGDAEAKFHIKQDAGGIVDIEFMVQYAVLAWANQTPSLLTYTDNIRILECLQQADLFSAQQANELIDAYKALRATGHRLALQEDENIVPGAALKSEQEKVTKHWRALFNIM